MVINNCKIKLEIEPHEYKKMAFKISNLKQAIRRLEIKIEESRATIRLLKINDDLKSNILKDMEIFEFRKMALLNLNIVVSILGKSETKEQPALAG